MEKLSKTDSYIQSWCDNHGVITSSFFVWKKALISATDKKISHFLARLTKKVVKTLWEWKIKLLLKS